MASQPLTSTLSDSPEQLFLSLKTLDTPGRKEKEHMRSRVKERLRENGIKLVGGGRVVHNDLSSLRSGKQNLIYQENLIYHGKTFFSSLA